VPDKLIQLETSKDHSLARIRANCKEINSKLSKKEIDECATFAYREWDVNAREVQSNFNQFINLY
jgi:hypothetical protein